MGGAATACGLAGLRWEQHVSLWRQCQALIAAGARRPLVAEPLRAAQRFALDVGAVPLQREVELVARIPGIPLDEPVVRAPRHADGPFSALTPRENEVLAHLVAGRTYGEIAAALFISEKTVSVHVSNILRKTATTSRKEVAALAVRLGHAAADA